MSSRMPQYRVFFYTSTLATMFFFAVTANVKQKDVNK